MNNLIDIATVGLIGQKAGLSTSIEEQVKEMLEVVGTGLKGVSTRKKQSADREVKRLEVQELSYAFAGLVGEALGLGEHGLDRFYDKPELMQHRAKIVKYPVVESEGDDQGVGAHYDAGFLTFVSGARVLWRIGSDLAAR